VLGGLARRVSYVNSVRSAGGTVLVVDSGRLFRNIATDTDRKRSLARARVIIRAYTHIGVTAVNVGESELTHGLPFLRRESSQGFPLISANLVDPLKKIPIFRPFVITKAGAARVAFFGLLSPGTSSAIQKTAAGKFLVKDPVETAREMFTVLRAQADIIVLLSDLEPERERAVAGAVPGLHFIFGGREGRYDHAPVKEGQTYILHSSRKGMYTGNLQVTFTNASFPFRDDGYETRIAKKMSDLDHRLRLIERSRAIEEDQRMKNAIRLINKQKTALKEELEKSRPSQSGNNRFLWTLIPLDLSRPEDTAVSEWIRRAGFEKD